MNRDIQTFVQKYDKYAANYPEIFLKPTPRLRAQAKKLAALNQRLFFNDDFSHAAIDLLVRSDNLATRGEVAVIAITVDYRREECWVILKDVLAQNDNPVFAHHLKFALRELNGGTL